MAPIHLQPTAPLAERVLLPGDPGRALLLAQSLIDEPRMFNHNRGLWGYTGAARVDGHPLTIQSTGMGGPSAAIVISELVDLGARELVRVGTCGAIVVGPQLGQLAVVTEALCADGTSQALGAGERAAGSPELLTRLRDGDTDVQALVAVSSDLFYGERAGAEQAWAAAGASLVEMESATLFALGRRREVATGALLIVSDLLTPTRRRIEAEALRDAEHRLGDIAMRALANG